MANLSVEQSLMKAKFYAKKGDLAEAQRLYETILNNLSNNLKAQQELANLKDSYIVQSPPQKAIDQLVTLFSQGKIEDVIKKAEALIMQYPEAPIVWNILGVSRAQLGKFDQAIMAYKKCISLKPNFADAHFNFGITLNNQGKSDDAICAFKKSIYYNPKYYEAYNNIGNILQNQGKIDAAIEAYKKAILLKPDYAEAYDNMGVAFKTQGKFEEAMDAYKKSILLKPCHAEAYNNLGNVLKDQGKLDEAIEFYKKALSHKSNYAGAYNNLGNAFKDKEKFDQALNAYNNALSIKPNYAEANYNSSFIHNLKGNFNKGLKLYEWRLKKKSFTARSPRDHLIWDGKKSILGKNFLVYEEQGLGDVIQFCRYLPLLKKKGAKVTFSVQKKMHQLLQSLDGELMLVDSIHNYDGNEFEAPLMSLPYLFKTDLNSIPSKTPYLYADINKAKSWKKRFSKDNFKIGICWQGSKNKIDIGRSFPLSLFDSISKLPNVELISLHKGDGEQQINDINFELTTFGDKFDSGQNAFIDTAAVMVNCDLIITSDTVTAHLAGALGCHTWVILKKVPEWRWMLDRNDSPWYPKMKLYRQLKQGNWKNVFQTVKKDLISLLNKEIQI